MAMAINKKDIKIVVPGGGVIELTLRPRDDCDLAPRLGKTLEDYVGYGCAVPHDDRELTAEPRVLPAVCIKGCHYLMRIVIEEMVKDKLSKTTTPP